MASDGTRLSTQEMHFFFLMALGNAVIWHGQLERKPLELDVARPYPLRLRVYMYNCTNPPGGRPRDEYKSQLIVPNQQRGARGNFDNSDGRLVLLVAYAVLYGAPEEGVFILYDALQHADFSYSANLQVKADIINRALVEPVAIGRKTNKEIIIAAQREYLCEAIDKRITVG